MTTFFSHRPLQSDDFFWHRLLTTPPTFRCRLASVLSKFSQKYTQLISVQVNYVTRGSPPPPSPPSDATANNPIAKSSHPIGNRA